VDPKVLGLKNRVLGIKTNSDGCGDSVVEKCGKNANSAGLVGLSKQWGKTKKDVET